GRGSSFHVVLPLEPPAWRADVPASPAVGYATAGVGAPGEGPLALVVEGDTPAAELLRRWLARGGHPVEGARDGRSALEKARLLEPVAVTLDVLPPDLDGWEVLR